MAKYIFHIEAKRIGSSKFISLSATRSGRTKDIAFNKLKDEFICINLINSTKIKKTIIDLDL
jgi:hypothetical protein